MLSLLLGLLLIAPFQQTPSTFLTWEYNTSLATVGGWTQTITVNGTTVTATPTCTALSPTQTFCQIPVTLNAAPANNNLSVMACNATGCATGNITNLNLSNLPLNPQNPKVNITITINVGG